MLKLEDLICRQITWSNRTFGPGARAQGIARHIMKEIDELAAATTRDERHAEMADLVILSIDGAWRAAMDWRRDYRGGGYTPQEHADAVHAEIMRETFHEAYRSTRHSAFAAVYYIGRIADGHITDAQRDVMVAYFAGCAAVSLADLVASAGWHEALQIIDAKQAKNRDRQWPAPGGQDQPVEHIKGGEAA